VTVTLDVAEPLRVFLRDRHRRRDAVTVEVDGVSSLGHVVQSVGVPLTEVGSLVVSGAAVSPASRPPAGAAVRLLPVARPQAAPTSPPRFLLDVHLGRLARRLRVLGLDTGYDRDADDAALTEVAAAESRVLLTQDRGLLMRRRLPAGAASGPPPWVAAYVRGRTAEEQLDDVLDRFAPPLAPWTRCAACNGELLAVPKASVAAELEPGTRREFDEFARCRSCGRVFWHGAHAKGLDALVARARERTHPA
jgi:uncharacterized protein with PIN domain